MSWTRPTNADRATGRTPRRSRHTAGLADGAKVGSVDISTLHADMLREFADGIRRGVPAQVLDGHRAYRDVHSLTVVNQRQGRIRQLEGQASDARDRARNARKNANEESDLDVRRDYQEDARRYTAHARSLEEEIGRLRAITDGNQLPDTFTGEVDFLLSALSALLKTEDGRVSEDQAAALRTVLHAFSLTLEGDRACWSASLLIPANDRVLAFGPFSGSVAAHGRTLTAAEVAELPNAAGSAQRRREVIHRLDEAGFPHHLSRAASLAPGGHLARVLLGEDVIWPDCSPSFDHTAFNEHVRSVWGAHPGWAASVYCQTNEGRQAIADLVAAFGGRASVADVDPYLEELGIKRNHVYLISRPTFTGNPSTPPWPATVRRTSEWDPGQPASSSVMVSPTCPRCGGPATAVVRVLEVTDALLCRTCRLMPSNGELEFPPIYLDLALPTHVIHLHTRDQA